MSRGGCCLRTVIFVREAGFGTILVAVTAIYVRTVQRLSRRTGNGNLVSNRLSNTDTDREMRYCC
jgi:hypothetical protein